MEPREVKGCVDPKKGGFPIEPKAEVFPVPVEMFPKLWPYARAWLQGIPGFDLARCRNRLLLGEDMLWMAAPFSWPVSCGDEKKRLAKKTGCIGVAITSVTEKPPLWGLKTQSGSTLRGEDGG